jgi:N-acetylglucosamine-6-sulfatase
MFNSAGSKRRRGFIVAAIWCLPPLVSGLLLLGMSPGPAGDPESSAPTGTGQQAEPITPGDPRQSGRTQPNIVVIMTDDMRADDIHGPWMRKTRELLGKQGVRFANTFVPLPLCCPARSSFLTGQYPHNHGVWAHVKPWGFPALDDSETLPVWLQRAGYNTAFLGKYLNGYSGQQPGDDVRDNSFYIPPGWTDWRAALGLQGTYDYWGTHLNDNGEIRSLEGQYQTRAYGRIGVDMIRRWAAEPKPFFFWLNFTAPHTGRPCERDDPGCFFGRANPNLGRENPGVGATPAVPQDRRGRYDHLVTKAPGVGYASERDTAGKPGFLRDQEALTPWQREALVEVTRQRYESESIVDDQVARLIAALRKTGELDNTVVMFTSDNGYFLGEHRMKHGKVLPYEPSMRIPLLMRGPGIPQGKIRNDPFSMIDFAPTILDLAGARTSFVTDGVSKVPTIRHGDQGWRRPVLTETGPRDENAARLPDGSAIPYSDDHPNALSPIQGVRVKNFMYIENLAGYRELYDLRVDPHEMNNVADDPRYRREVMALATVLDRLRGCAGASCEVLLPRVLLPDGAAPSGGARTGQASKFDATASPSRLSTLRQ